MGRPNTTKPAILKLFKTKEQILKAKEIIEKTRLPSSTVYQALMMMVIENMLVRRSRGNYALV